MEYFRGDRVRILGKLEWGTNFIQGKSKNGKVKVEFQDAGAKTLSLRYAKLMKVKVALCDLDWFKDRVRREWIRN